MPADRKRFPAGRSVLPKARQYPNTQALGGSIRTVEKITSPG